MSNLVSNHELMSIDDQTLTNIMNKRHRSAKSIIKNPPQPRFCIKATTSDGRDLFINVLSYSRIANQLSEFDPIPLYGGMQIRSYGSIKNAAHIQQPSPTQLIFAVMASPEVLKNTGRSCAESPEQMNLVELMCEFVEAMNPGIVLSKKPEILKDRDLAGELKDVWTAVQNFRDKEKAGISDIVVYTEFGPDSGQESLAHRNEPNNEKSVKKEIHDAIKPYQYSESQNNVEMSGDGDESNDETAAEREKSENIVHSENFEDELSTQTIEIDKLALEDEKEGSRHHETHQNNEKIVKIQNQRNKESQHHFFPKFLSSSKEKEAKDKEKEKQQDVEPKTKTKKSLNFFRRNKSSASSPTHPSNNNVNDSEKSDSTEH